MIVADLLLETLHDLDRDTIVTFRWFLSNGVLNGCERIPKSKLENATRIVTVDRMIAAYGEENAVMVTVAILRKMSYNNAADELMRKYAEVKTAAPPATISAQQGSIIVMPSINNSTAGPVTITIQK